MNTEINSQGSHFLNKWSFLTGSFYNNYLWWNYDSSKISLTWYWKEKARQDCKRKLRKAKDCLEVSTGSGEIQNPTIWQNTTKMLKPDWTDILNYVLIFKEISDHISSFKNTAEGNNELNKLNWENHIHFFCWGGSSKTTKSSS